MEIPTPYIFKIETPLLLYRDHLFQPRNLTTNRINYIEIMEKRFNLDEIAAPKVLEDLYFDNNKEFFEQYKQDFLSTSMNQLYMSNESIEAELRNNRTLDLIIKEILPVITSVKMDNQIDAALNDKTHSSREDIKDIFSNITKSPGRLRIEEDPDVVSRTRNELISEIERSYSRIGTPRPRKSVLENYIERELMGSNTGSRLASSPSPSILTDELLGDMNVLWVENRTYSIYTIPKLLTEFQDKISSRYMREVSRMTPDMDPSIIVESVRKNYDQIDSSVLSRIINKLRSTKLNIEGNYFFPLYLNENSDMVSDYKKLIEKKVKIEAIHHTRFQAESLRKIAEEKAQLSKLVDTNKVDINGAGFEKIHGSYYVYITTPPYVLRSPHDNEYYKFGSAKIGLEILVSNNNSVTIMEPMVLNHYKHPFLSSEASNQRICMGHYHTDSARRLPPGQAVLTILTKAQENLMMGYRTGGNPYKRLCAEIFGSQRITPREFERSGLPCLNDYRDSSRSSYGR